MSNEFDDTEFVDDESTEYSEEEVPAESNYLDMDEYSDYRVRANVDGEESEISISEAIAGYQRQADYTRKTQQLSSDREDFQFASALQAALEDSPADTIRMLQDHYGISKRDAEQLVEDENLDPTERRYRDLDNRLAQFEDDRSLREVEDEISALQDFYGDDFDVQEVVNSALKRGTTDLEGVYKQMAFDRIVAQSRLETGASQRRAATEDSVVQSKRAASVVSGGSSATGNTTSEGRGPITSIADAWAAAKLQHGAS